MRLVCTLLVTSLGLFGCQSVPDRCREILPLRILDSEPLYTGEISIESDDAAIRYIAMRDEFFGDISTDSYDVEHDNWDQFVAIRFDDELVDTKVYVEYLHNRQELFELADASSKLQRFGDFGLPFAIYEGREPEGDPRRDLGKTMRKLTLTLADDAQRHWIDGNRTLAITRVRTIFNISRQIQLKGDFADIDGLVAIAIARVGLDRLHRMVRSKQASMKDYELILETAHMLDGSDPLGVYCERTRTIRSMQAWLETQLDEEEGTIELWAFIARFLGTQEVVSQLFRDVVTISLMSGEEIHTEVDEDVVLRQLLDDLDGIDIEMVRDRYRQYAPLVQIALDELRSESPNSTVLRELRDSTIDDTTAVSDILGLSVLGAMIRQYADVLESRDVIIEELNGP